MCADIDNQDDLFFALETQTRPVYSKFFWQDAGGNPVNGDSVVVHELAGHGTTPEFIALAERISCQQLDEFFDVWLFTGEKPASPDAADAAASRAAASAGDEASDFARQWLAKASERLERGRY
jgi:hypothetical protein